jgi:hypothetical protein
MSTIVFTFGRLNPPTEAHRHLVMTVLETAKKNSADHVVYLSQTRNNSTDPLDWPFKKRVCEAAFPGVNISDDQSIKTPFQALKHLSEDYEKMILVVGSDRSNEFYERMSPYADKYNVDLQVYSAGTRIAESEGIDGLSSSKLRKYALEGNDKMFFEGLPKTLNQNIKNLILRNVQIGLKSDK